MKAGAIRSEDFELLTQLRMIRNQQVHSTSVDRKQVELAVEMPISYWRRSLNGRQDRSPIH